MLVAIDYNQGFNDQPGNTTKPRTSIGADWVLGTIAVRSGFSFGGIDNFNWGFGLGLDFGILALNFWNSGYGKFNFFQFSQESFVRF